MERKNRGHPHQRNQWTRRWEDYRMDRWSSWWMKYLRIEACIILWCILMINSCTKFYWFQLSILISISSWSYTSVSVCMHLWRLTWWGISNGYFHLISVTSGVWSDPKRGLSSIYASIFTVVTHIGNFSRLGWDIGAVAMLWPVPVTPSSSTPTNLSVPNIRRIDSYKCRREEGTFFLNSCLRFQSLKLPLVALLPSS